MAIDDGYIKYDRSHFLKTEELDLGEYVELEDWRKILFQKELIGEYISDKIGYGNMSCLKNYQRLKKTNKPQFCITSTQTGKHPHLTGKQYTRVVDFDMRKNTIYSQGLMEASSEALTHGAIYEGNTNIHFIFHIHSPKIWQGMIDDQLPFTSEDIPYGTVEMAESMKNLVQLKSHGHFVMKGHEDGVIIYAETAQLAGKLTLDLFKRYCTF